MNVDLALRAFAADERFPGEAMTWALANRTAAAPRFVARLRAFAAGSRVDEAAENEAFYLIHLCGQMRETRAYEPLCRMIANDPDIEIWLGDAMTETLPGILVNTFDGDTAPLMTAIESEGADDLARGAALAALGYLVRSQGALDDEAMRAYLRRLRRDARPREIPGLWLSWAGAAAGLGYDDLKMDFAMLTKDGLLDPRDFDRDDFDRIVRQAQSDPTGLTAFHDQGLRPDDDLVATLESWRRAAEEGQTDGAEHEAFPPDDAPSDEPHVNPFRDVGRNDPCPCGSGKKYKKCCLAS